MLVQVFGALSFCRIRWNSLSFVFSRAASDAVLRSSLAFLNSTGFLSNRVLVDALRMSSSEFFFSWANVFELLTLMAFDGGG
jgi:hypothetical protein